MDCGDGTTSVVPIFHRAASKSSRFGSEWICVNLSRSRCFEKRSVMRADSDAYENEDEVETKEERENRFEEKWRYMIRPLGDMKRFHTNCTYLSSCRRRRRCFLTHQIQTGAFLQRDDDDAHETKIKYKRKDNCPLKGIPEEIYKALPI